jgi:hypothetical protein
MLTKTELKEIALGQHVTLKDNIQVELGGVMYGASVFATPSILYANDGIVRQKGAGTRALMIPGDTEPRVFTNADILNALIEADEALQKHDDILRQIFDLIDNETITTEEDVTNAWGTLNAMYVSTRELTPTNEELAQRIDNIEQGLQTPS